MTLVLSSTCPYHLESSLLIWYTKRSIEGSEKVEKKNMERFWYKYLDDLMDSCNKWLIVLRLKVCWHYRWDTSSLNQRCLLFILSQLNLES